MFVTIKKKIVGLFFVALMAATMITSSIAAERKGLKEEPSNWSTKTATITAQIENIKKLLGEKKHTLKVEKKNLASYQGQGRIGGPLGAAGIDLLTYVAMGADVGVDSESRPVTSAEKNGLINAIVYGALAVFADNTENLKTSNIQDVRLILSNKLNALLAENEGALSNRIRNERGWWQHILLCNEIFKSAMHAFMTNDLDLVAYDNEYGEKRDKAVNIPQAKQDYLALFAAKIEAKCSLSNVAEAGNVCIKSFQADLKPILEVYPGVFNMKYMTPVYLEMLNSYGETYINSDKKSNGATMLAVVRNGFDYKYNLNDNEESFVSRAREVKLEWNIYPDRDVKIGLKNKFGKK